MRVSQLDPDIYLDYLLHPPRTVDRSHDRVYGWECPRNPLCRSMPGACFYASRAAGWRRLHHMWQSKRR